MNDIPTLITSRLTLRQLSLEDAETLHRIYQNDGVLRYFPNPTPPPLDRVRRSIDWQTQHWVTHGYGNWGIIPKGELDIIGWAGLQYLTETEETEVGFLLDRPAWGKGYATEAALASLHFGFERYGFQQVIGLVHPENLASQHVLEKCGMTYVENKVYFGIELMRYMVGRVNFQQRLSDTLDFSI